MRKIRVADRDLVKTLHGQLLCQLGGDSRCCDHRKVGDAALNGVDCLRGGMVADLKVNIRMQRAVFLQNGQQHAVQRNLAGRDGQRAALELAAARDLVLPGLDLFKSDPDVRKEPFALGRELHAARAAHKKTAVERALERFDRACQVRLTVQQQRCRARNAPVSRNVIKNFIVVVADIHTRPSFSIPI